MIRLVTDPIGHWLTTHTNGLPITADTAALVWGVTGIVLFLAASYHHLGARLLWPLYGIATIAMAWAGTDNTVHRPVIAGLLGITWAALSLIGLSARRRSK